MNKTELEECEVTGNTLQKKENPVLIDTTKTKVVGIYGLQNKLDPSKWYIGQSIDIVKRFSDYRNLRCSAQKKIYRALKKYGFENFNQVVLEECVKDENVLNDREEHWTLHYDSIKSGYNIRLAGKSPMFGRTHTEKHKEHMRQKMKGRTFSLETLRKMSVACTGRVHSDATKDKLSAARKKRVISKETGLKISAANTGHAVSNETKQKISNANRGHPVSVETRLKISIGNKDKTISGETRLKMSIARKGKPLSESHKESLKKAWVLRRLS